MAGMQRCTHTQLGLKATFEDLRRKMGMDSLPEGFPANERLTEHNVTDGSVLQLLQGKGATQTTNQSNLDDAIAGCVRACVRAARPDCLFKIKVCCTRQNE
jgi:hypothetical protein